MEKVQIIHKVWNYLPLFDKIRQNSTNKYGIRYAEEVTYMAIEKYKINTETLAIIPISKKKSKIYESDSVFVVNTNAKKIISENCEYFGSSYAGRKKGTMELIGITHKAPILIEEANNLIFFPTSSPRLNDCGWISLNNLESYQPYDDESVIRFQNNLKLQVNASNKIIDNQVLRATRLESVIRKRKSGIAPKDYRKK